MGSDPGAAAGVDADLVPFAEYLPVFRRTEGGFGIESAAIWDSILDLQERRDWRGHQLEIGVHEGRSAALMARRVGDDERLLLVDEFLRREAVERAVGALRPLPDPRVQLVQHDSHLLHDHEALRGLERSFRFVHIDGERSEAAIFDDLDLAHRLGSDRCLVSVDDIFVFAYPQLTEALLRYLRQHPERFTMVLVGYGKAYLTRPAFAREYLRFVDEELVARLERIGIETTLAKTSHPGELNAFGIGPRLEGRLRIGLDRAPDQLPY